ncbi:MAG: GNAT family N-acetyltransferase [Leptolyngbyaceae cyanobacterium SM2_5_2]|nr:GNAT family N-acetyltransferase [Leptolyngbyaceae cyanobacterium SM2_5_2]
MTIRLATAADLPELATLFRETVLAHAPHYYSPAQTQAWATAADDPQRLSALILNVTTYVVEDDTGILGFAGLGEDGYVASAYVRYDRLHQGIGSRLMEIVLAAAKQQGMTRLHSEASEFSLGLFQKFGFRLYDTEIVERSGVRFKRYLVEKTGITVPDGSNSAPADWR